MFGGREMTEARLEGMVEKVGVRSGNSELLKQLCFEVEQSVELSQGWGFSGRE